MEFSALKRFFACMLLAAFAPVVQAMNEDDMLWETVYLASHVADWGQTRDIASQCRSGSYIETNPIIGRCPTHARVNLYFITTALLHIGTVHFLPSQYRRWFQWGTTGMELTYVNNNAEIGLQMRF
jgi:hypothetical protein